MGFCLLSACGGISHEFFLPMPGVLSTFFWKPLCEADSGEIMFETEASFSRVRKSLIVFFNS